MIRAKEAFANLNDGLTFRLRLRNLFVHDERIYIILPDSQHFGMFSPKLARFLFDQLALGSNGALILVKPIELFDCDAFAVRLIYLSGAHCRM